MADTKMKDVGEDEDYNSSSDSDFAAADLSASSADEGDDSTEEAGQNAPSKSHKKGRKIPKAKIDADGDLEMGSGDEGIIAEGQKLQKKRNKKKQKQKKKGKSSADKGHQDGSQAIGNDGGSDTAGDESEDQQGIRVRLRSGRGGEESKQTKSLAIAKSTIDIDAVWARMNNPSKSSSLAPDTTEEVSGQSKESLQVDTSLVLKETTATDSAISPAASTIVIPHTYKFAGETFTTTKTVAATSKEALAYIAKRNGKDVTDPEFGTAINPELSKSTVSLRRPLARKDIRQPNPTNTVQGILSPPRSDLPPSIGGNGAQALGSQNTIVSWADRKAKPQEQGATSGGPKLNVVEKSKLDWQQEVERQGIREELDKAEKSNNSYLGRMDFLGRAEGAREDEARRARLAVKV